MSYTVTDIANYFIWRANSDAEFGENISNLKLQKLVYYAQGFSLALTQEPLFEEPIMAWAHGPVVPSLYHTYSQHGAKAIPTPNTFDPEALDGETQELLEDVYQVYGRYSAWALRNLTHEEPPWKNTPRNEVIPLKAMREFFLTQIKDG